MNENYLHNLYNHTLHYIGIISSFLNIPNKSFHYWPHSVVKYTKSVIDNENLHFT